MERADFVDSLEEDGVRMSRAAERAGLESAVPSCPGWDVRGLVHHTGAVHRWATLYVTSGKSEPSAEDYEVFSSVVADDGLLEWFDEGHRNLVGALRDADPGLACWAFLPARSPLDFWSRRQAHETAVHRVDAELASGEAPAYRTDLALDGIDEFLYGFLERIKGRLALEAPVRFGLEVTDAARSWSLSLGAGSVAVSEGDASGDCIVKGPAKDVYLFLWNRRAAVSGQLGIEGDVSLAETWETTVRV